jgi:hypothetical protein
MEGFDWIRLAQEREKLAASRALGNEFSGFIHFDEFLTANIIFAIKIAA